MFVCYHFITLTVQTQYGTLYLHACAEFFFFMFQCEIFISLPWKLLMNIININNIFPNIAQFSNTCLCYRKASLQKKRNWTMMRIGEIHSISLNVALSMNMMIEQWPRICELLFKSLCTFMTLKFTKEGVLTDIRYFYVYVHFDLGICVETSHM